MGKSKDKNRLGGRHCIKSAYDGQLGKKVTAGVQAYFAHEHLGYVNINDSEVTTEQKNNMRDKAAAYVETHPELRFMQLSELADHPAFILALGVMWHTKLNREKTAFKPNAGLVEVTMQQLAISAFKIQNRLCDPLQDGANRGGSHCRSIEAMLVKLEAERAVKPCTAIKIIDPEPAE